MSEPVWPTRPQAGWKWPRCDGIDPRRRICEATLMVKDGDYVGGGPAYCHCYQKPSSVSAGRGGRARLCRYQGIRSAKFEPAYSSGSVYDLTDMGGRLVSYGRAPGAGGAFIPVTFEFDNTGDILPDSYAEIYLIGAERPGVISVPVGALTEEQGVMFVYIQEDESLCQARGQDRPERRRARGNSLRHQSRR